jgi:hypothetical protein
MSITVFYCWEAGHQAQSTLNGGAVLLFGSGVSPKVHVSQACGTTGNGRNFKKWGPVGGLQVIGTVS